MAVGENNLELTRSDHGIGWKAPLSEVGIGNGQAEVAERNQIGGRVVKLQPATALAGAVGNPGQIVGLQLIQPKWRERWQAGGDRVGRCRAARGWREAAGPVRHAPVVLARVDQLERAALSISSRRPGRSALITHFGHDVARAAGSGLHQRQGFTACGQRRGEGIEDRKLGPISAGKGSAVGSQDEVVGGSEQRPGGEGIRQTLHLPC